MRFTLEFGERRSSEGYRPKVFAPEARASLENPSVSLVDPAAWRQIFGEYNSDSGISVDPVVAMSVPAIWCAVNFLANTMAALPIKLYRKSVNGRETIEGGAVAQLLSGTVNDKLLTSFNWRRDAMTSTLLTGRGLTYIERQASGDARYLWPLDMPHTTIKRTGWDITYSWRVDDTSKAKTYEADEVLDIKFLGALDGVDVFNPIQYLKDAIGQMVALRRYGSRYFQNGGVPPLALEGPAASPQAVSRAKDDMTEAVRQSNRNGEQMLYLPTGHKLTPIGFEPEKGQLVEARRFALEEASRIYNLPPTFLHNLERATFGNVEQQDLDLVKHCIVHWVEQWEQELNAKLFGSTRKRYVEFDLNGLMRGDMEGRMTAYAQAVMNGIFKPNEVRRRENLPDVDGGDTLFMQSTVQPIGTADPKTTGATDEEIDDDDPA